MIRTFLLVFWLALPAGIVAQTSPDEDPALTSAGGIESQPVERDIGRSAEGTGLRGSDLSQRLVGPEDPGVTDGLRSADGTGMRSAEGTGLRSVARMQTYITRAGDSLSAIAARLYGDASRWRLIWQANTALVPDPNDLDTGVTLVIPETDE